MTDLDSLSTTVTMTVEEKYLHRICGTQVDEAMIMAHECKTNNDSSSADPDHYQRTNIDSASAGEQDLRHDASTFMAVTESLICAGAELIESEERRHIDENPSDLVGDGFQYVEHIINELQQRPTYSSVNQSRSTVTMEDGLDRKGTTLVVPQESFESRSVSDIDDTATHNPPLDPCAPHREAPDVQLLHLHLIGRALGTMWRWKWALTTVIAVGLVRSSMQTWKRERHRAAHIPAMEMDSFIQTAKAVDIEVTDVTSLPASKFAPFVGASCMEATSYDQAKKVLEIQLDHLPVATRDSVIGRALIPKLTHQGSTQNTSNNFNGKQDEGDEGILGRVYTYMAFWSTTYSPPSSFPNTPEKYSICVLVSGLECLFPETIIGYEVSNEQVMVGVEDCNCGALWCDICPVYSEVEHRVPIFDRQALSLQKQKELHDWVVQEAVDLAEKSLAGRLARARQVLGEIPPVVTVACSPPESSSHQAVDIVEIGT